jgi:hypothetical protein
MGTGGRGRASTSFRRQTIRSHDHNHDHGRQSWPTTHSQLSTYSDTECMGAFNHVHTNIMEGIQLLFPFNSSLQYTISGDMTRTSLKARAGTKWKVIQGRHKMGSDRFPLSTSSSFIRPDPICPRKCSLSHKSQSTMRSTLLALTSPPEIT